MPLISLIQKASQCFKKPHDGPWRFFMAGVWLIVVCGLSFFIIYWGLQSFPEPIGSRAQLFSDGARTTLTLTLSANILGLIFGMVAALAKLSHGPILVLLARTYLWLFRGTPLLTQILFVYYAVPVIFPFLKLNEWMGAFLALSLNVGAYHAEAIRAGILSVPSGQTEAARVLGLSRWQINRHVVLPQALPIMTPPLLNNLVALLKDSAMASVIGLLELTLAGNRVASETFLPVPVFTTLAMTYLFLTTTVTLVSQIVFHSTSPNQWLTGTKKK